MSKYRNVNKWKNLTIGTTVYKVTGYSIKEDTIEAIVVGDKTDNDFEFVLDRGRICINPDEGFLRCYRLGRFKEEAYKKWFLDEDEAKRKANRNLNSAIQSKLNKITSIKEEIEELMLKHHNGV